MEPKLARNRSREMGQVVTTKDAALSAWRTNVSLLTSGADDVTLDNTLSQ